MSADQGGQPNGGQPQTQKRRNTPQSGSGFGHAPESPTQRYAMFGIAVYGAYAIVRFLHDFLEAILSHDESVYFQASDNPMYSASSASFFANNDQILLLVALAVGAFYVYSVTTHEPAYKPAAIAASAGIAAVSVVSMVLILLFVPDGVNIELGNEIIGLLVAIVGSGIAAAVTAEILERAPNPSPR